MVTLLILLGIFIVFIVAGLAKTKSQRRNGHHSSRSRNINQLRPVMKECRNANGDVTLEIDWPETFLVIEQAVQYQNYEFARTWLQKFSYGTVGNEVPQSIRNDFKRLMAAFCREDPLYRQIMQRAVPIVAAQPGMLQTALYPQLPSHSEEQIRYALYFAHELGDLVRLKKGRSYQLFGPMQTTTILPGERIGATVVSSTVHITKNPIEEKIAALHQEATANKKTNWDKAITCLQEAADLMRRHDSKHETERWTRLPVFLQQAGRFDEAMLEFERLLKEVKPRMLNEMSESRYPGAVKIYTHLAYCQIYDKMRMACKRQKMPDKASEYQDLSERHRLVFDELRRVADLAQDAELEAFKQRREHQVADRRVD